MRPQLSEKPYGDGLSIQKSQSKLPIVLAKHGSGRKGRGDSRSQSRRFAMEVSSSSQTRRDGSYPRKQKAAPAVPMKTKEEIEQETEELNQNAN